MTHTYLRRLSFLMLLVLLVLPVAVAHASEDNAAHRPRVIAPEELQGNIGAMVTMPVPALMFVKQDFVTQDVQGQLFFSDNPESITGEGITYRGEVSGYARVYVYHANDEPQSKYFMTWMINRGDEPVTVRVTREGLGGPGVDYGYIGQNVLEDYLGPQVERTVVVPPHGRELLDQRVAELPARQYALIHGVYDIEVDGTVEILIAAVNSPSKDPETLPDYPPNDPIDTGRGLFQATERHMDFTVGDFPSGVLLSSGQPNDLWAMGLDQVYDRSVSLPGNYGVMYHIDMTVDVTQPKRVRFFMAPGFDGGGHCPMAPSIRITGDEHTYFGEHEDGLVVRVTKDGVLYMTRPNQAAFLGEIVVMPGDPRVLRLDFMPPGGSCLAGALIAWPVDLDGPGVGLRIHGLDEALVPWESSADFYDPFDTKTSYWSWSATSPVFDSGHAVWSTQVYGNAFAGLADGRDYSFEARARFDGQGTFSLFLRSSRLWQGYEVSVDLFSQRIWIRRMKGTWDHSDVLASVPLNHSLKVGDWFTVRATMQDNRITVLLNDEQVLTASDPDNMYPTGRVGFRVGYTPMRLDYARLSPLP